MLNKKNQTIVKTVSYILLIIDVYKRQGLEIPNSYEEFIQICDTLKAEGICPLAIGGNQEEDVYKRQHFICATAYFL